MNNPARTAKQAPKKAVALTPPFSMTGLWRLALWGGTAAGATLIAVLATHSEVGSQRAVGALSSLTGRQVALLQAEQPARPAASPLPGLSGDDTRRLAEAVRNLSADNRELRSRLAALETNFGDLTGSVTRQIDEAKSAVHPTPSWPDDATAPINAAAIASLLSPSLPPPDGLLARAAAAIPPAPAPISLVAAPAQRPAEPARIDSFGIDIGSGLSIQALRARWAGMRSAHPEFFDALAPLVTLKEAKKPAGAPGGTVELRLVAGPVASADTAAQLCAALAVIHLFCQPTAYIGQPLAQ
jgi:hypothetical protein